VARIATKPASHAARRTNGSTAGQPDAPTGAAAGTANAAVEKGWLINSTASVT
jgi:hypothetical protein